MTTPTREQVIEWAEEAGAIQLNEEGWATVIQGGIGDMQRFAVLAMSAGRDQGLREAKEVCEQNAKRWPDLRGFYVANECAAAIEQLRGE